MFISCFSELHKSWAKWQFSNLGGRGRNNFFKLLFRSLTFKSNKYLLWWMETWENLTALLPAPLPLLTYIIILFDTSPWNFKEFGELKFLNTRFWRNGIPYKKPETALGGDMMEEITLTCAWFLNGLSQRLLESLNLYCDIEKRMNK